MNNKNTLDLHKECFKLEYELRTFYNFSSKIKHLKLCYKNFEEFKNNILNQFSAHKENNVPFGDEYSALQFERFVLEILAHIFSIDDIIKSFNFIPNINDKGNHLLYRIAKQLRNKLTHESVPELFFYTNIIEHLSIKTLNIYCKYHKLIKHVLKWDSGCSIGIYKNTNKFNKDSQHGEILFKDNNFFMKNYADITPLIFKESINAIEKENFINSIERDKSDIIRNNNCKNINNLFKNYIWDEYSTIWKYIWDDHLHALHISSILGEAGIAELQHRCQKLNISTENLNNNSIIILPTQIYIEHLKDKHINFYDALLNNKNYRLFSIIEFTKIEIENPEIKQMLYANDIHFSIGDLVNDIYNFFIKYYDECHASLYEKKYSQEINNFQDLLEKLNKSTECLNRYSCQLPIIK